MASNDFKALLSTFKAATGVPERSSNAAASSHDLDANKTNATTQHVSDGPSSSTTASRATTGSTKQPKSLLEATTELWRIAEIRRSAGLCCDGSISGTSTAGTAKQEAGQGSNHPKGFHLAICACIVDDLPQEDVWRRFMRPDNFIVDQTSDTKGSSSNLKLPATAELYIHAKHPERVRSGWARSKTITKCYRPEWNDVRVVRAMISLAEEALNDSKTTHVLFCTESCLPIDTVAEVADRVVLGKKPGKNTSTRTGKGGETDNETHILNWDRSYVDLYGKDSPRCTRFDEHNCWDILKRSIPADAIQKALPGWCLLSRKHIEGILDIPRRMGQDLWPAFQDVWAPDEVYFPTCLSLLGHLSGGDVVREPLTYSEWNERARNQKDRAHPIVFDGCFENDHAFIRQLRRDGCTFLRKLKRPVAARVWEDVIIHTGRGRSSVGSRQDYYRDHERGRQQFSYHDSSSRKRRRNDDSDDRWHNRRGR